MDKNDQIFFRPHGCVMCRNLTELSAKCCCPGNHDALVEITEDRLLKRSNLRKGDKLCQMHHEKLKNGLIFGVGNTSCCAPFHVGVPKNLKSVPRTWRHLFDTSNLKERYLPTMQICSQCYKIVLDLLLKQDKSEEFVNWDFDSSSIASGRESYTSPRRWISSFSLFTNGSSSSSFLSSCAHLNKGSSNQLMSLYETHRERLGHPKAIPDSINRYFKYGHIFSPGFKKKSQLRHANSFELTKSEHSKKTGQDLKLNDKDIDRNSKFPFTRITSSASLPLPEISADTEFMLYQSNSANISLTPNIVSSTATRVAHKRHISVAKGDCEVRNKSGNSSITNSSTELDSDWEILSVSICSDFESENQVFDSTQDASSNLLNAVSDNKSIRSNETEISIKVQSIVNPSLKLIRTSKTNSSNKIKHENLENIVSNAHKEREHPNTILTEQTPNGVIQNHETLSAYNSLKIQLTKPAFTKSSNNKNSLLINHNDFPPKLINFLEKFSSLGTSHQNVNQLINFNEKSNFNVVEVFASALSYCVVSFAIHDVSRGLISFHDIAGRDVTFKTLSVAKNGKMNMKNEELFDNENKKLIRYAREQTENIILKVLDKMKEQTKTDYEKTKTLNNPLPSSSQCLPKQTNTDQKLFTKLTSQTLTVTWLKDKQCYQTLFSVKIEPHQVQNVNRKNSLDKSKDVVAPEDSNNSCELNKVKDKSLANQLQIVDYVVEDLLPVTRSFSTGSINKIDNSLFSPNKLMRSTSFDSCFSLNCQIVSENFNGGKEFIAKPINCLRSSDEPKSGVFVSSTTVEFSSSNDEALPNFDVETNPQNQLMNRSISSAESDLSSSTSTLNDSENFEAEILEQKKLIDRPHYISHKSRVNEVEKDVPPARNDPFPLIPELDRLSELQEDLIDGEETSSQYTETSTSIYTETYSSIPSNFDINKNESSSKDQQENKGMTEDTVKTNKASSVNAVKRSFDWYTGEDVMESTRKKQLLRVLSDATMFSNQTKKRGPILRPKKTDEDSEDEDVSAVLGKAIESETPPLFRRTLQSKDNKESRPSVVTIFRVVAVVGIVGVLFYAGWRLYS